MERSTARGLQDLDVILNAKEDFGDNAFNKISYLFLLFVKNMRKLSQKAKAAETASCGVAQAARRHGSWALPAAGPPLRPGPPAAYSKVPHAQYAL